MRLHIDVDNVPRNKGLAHGINALNLTWCEDNPPKVLTKEKRTHLVNCFCEHFCLSKQESRWLVFWCCTLFSLNSKCAYTIQGGYDNDYVQQGAIGGWLGSTVGRMRRLGGIGELAMVPCRTTL